MIINYPFLTFTSLSLCLLCASSNVGVLVPHGWMLSCLRMALVVLVCWFLVTKSIKIGFRTGYKLMMALMKYDVFIGG